VARKGIREFDGKRILASALPEVDARMALVGPETDLTKMTGERPWLEKTKLVVKPDQLFGKRGKHGLIGLGLDWSEAKAWIAARMDTEVQVSGITGKLTHFIVEPFVPHDTEYYVAMRMGPNSDTLYLSNEGGVDVEENWDRVSTIDIPTSFELNSAVLSQKVREVFGTENAAILTPFLSRLYELFCRGNFAYLEINPFSIVGGRVIVLDLVAKMDDTGEFECRDLWGELSFPTPFGRTSSKEEAFIEELDSKTGASLKLTILNPKGRVWTMVAGGGASVIYADTVCDLGFGEELANYGEYSGNPNKELTYHYASTVLDLMTREPDHEGRSKVLFIGGGIANFTDVAATFTGIIKALQHHAAKLREQKVRILVRRGGPNYKVGLDNIRRCGDEIGVPIEVFGPEAHMTHIVALALEKEEVGR